MDDNTVRPAVFLYDRNSGKWKLDWEAWKSTPPCSRRSWKPKNPPTRPRQNSPQHARHLPAALPGGILRGKLPNTAYINFSLEFPNGERLNAYVDRYSPLALELTKLLYNGPVRACVLIHYPADLPGNQSVIIDKLLYSGWMSDATLTSFPPTDNPEPVPVFHEFQSISANTGQSPPTQSGHHHFNRTFAEIGAGQETANWLRASGAAGTVAKTISAYDMTVPSTLHARQALRLGRTPERHAGLRIHPARQPPGAQARQGHPLLRLLQYGEGERLPGNGPWTAG